MQNSLVVLHFLVNLKTISSSSINNKYQRFTLKSSKNRRTLLKSMIKSVDHRYQYEQNSTNSHCLFVVDSEQYSRVLTRYCQTFAITLYSAPVNHFDVYSMNMYINIYSLSPDFFSSSPPQANKKLNRTMEARKQFLSLCVCVDLMGIQFCFDPTNVSYSSSNT